MARMTPVMLIVLLLASVFPALAADPPQPVSVVVPAGDDEIVIERTPAEQRLIDIVEAGRTEVAALAATLDQVTDPAQRREVQIQIGELKQAWRVRFLEEHVAIAEESGDEARKVEAQDQLDRMRDRIAGREPAQVVLPRQAEAQR